jgi:hypothetical protein
LTTAPTPTSAELPDSRERWLWYLLVGTVAVVAVACVVLWWPGGPEEKEPAIDPTCEEFARLKNDGDPGANDLLSPMPAIPFEPVTEAEAARLDADIVLHRDFKVNRVTPLPSTGSGHRRYVLWLQGGLCSETFTVRTADGKLERGQRMLTNPDVIVEVRDGKIYGVKAMLHEDASTRRR